MLPKPIITAHLLAKLLLEGDDLPVVIPTKKNDFDCELIQNISMMQNQDSPFEYSILLEGSLPIKNDIIHVQD